MSESGCCEYRDWSIKLNVHVHVGGSPRGVADMSTENEDQGIALDE